MCWPELVGGVEVEERRPRTWNEPRLKRLKFVRGHRREPEDWTVTTPYPRLSEREIWDRHRARQMEQQRVMHPVPHPPFQGHLDPRMLQMPPAPPQLHHIQPGHHGHAHGFDHQGHHGHQAQLDRRSHHSEDDIGFADFGHDDHDRHDGHDNQERPSPRIIPIEPSKSHLPKGFKVYAKKSGAHRKKYSMSSSSSDDCSSPDGSFGFSEGFRAGRRSLSRRPVSRGRSRSRLTDDSFEDLMQSQMRSRSRRGRR